MIEYQNKEELILEISKRAKLFIDEFKVIDESDRNLLLDGENRTPNQMLAYQIGWMKLILSFEKQEKAGLTVITPSPDYKWNELSSLYESFYKEFEEDSLKDLSAIFINTLQDIIILINTYTDEDLFEQNKRKWASSTPSNWTVSKWIHINTVAPFKSFRTKIRKWKKLNSFC